MNIATRPKLFPCSEVIGWILPRADVTTTMILENVDKHGYAAYSPGYVALAYHLPEAQIFLIEDLVEKHQNGPRQDPQKNVVSRKKL